MGLWLLTLWGTPPHWTAQSAEPPATASEERRGPVDPLLEAAMLACDEAPCPPTLQQGELVLVEPDHPPGLAAVGAPGVCSFQVRVGADGALRDLEFGDCTRGFQQETLIAARASTYPTLLHRGQALPYTAWLVHRFQPEVTLEEHPFTPERQAHCERGRPEHFQLLEDNPPDLRPVRTVNAIYPLQRPNIHGSCQVVLEVDRAGEVWSADIETCSLNTGVASLEAASQWRFSKRRGGQPLETYRVLFHFCGQAGYSSRQVLYAPWPSRTASDPPGETCSVELSADADGLPTETTPLSCPDALRRPVEQALMNARLAATYDHKGRELPSRWRVDWAPDPTAESGWAEPRFTQLDADDKKRGRR